MSGLNDMHQEQFLRVFAEHGPVLRTFVRSLVPSLADASEVMQEVAVVLWQKFVARFSVEPPALFPAWASPTASMPDQPRIPQ